MAQKKKKSTRKPEVKKAKRKPFFKITVITIVVILAAFFIVNNFIDGDEVTEYYQFTKEGELTFTDSLGNKIVTIDLEIADGEYETQLGLMNRDELGEKEGMLFIFPIESFHSFWMRNTLISLDIIYLNKEKEIVTIHKNTEPLSAKSYRSSEPIMFVVEVNAGFTDRYGIKLGDKIDWGKFETSL